MAINVKKSDTKENKKRLKEILEILMSNEVSKSITPKKLCTLLNDLGPSFIKLAKIMSNSQNILPKEYNDEIKNIEIKSSAMNYEQIKSFLEKEYGLPIDEVFLEIDETPICVSAISQSHRATLKEGPQIILKIQKPEIYQTISTDITLIKKTLTILNLETNKNDFEINLADVFDEIWDICQKETNYLLEAKNIEKFYKLNKNSDFIVSPKAYPKYTTANVLAVEYIDGINLDSISSEELKTYNTDEMAYKLLNNYIKQIVKDRFFNANPVAKNILLKNERIALINFNLIGKLSKENVENIRRMSSALKEQNIAELKNILLSESESSERINNAKIYSGLESIIISDTNKTLCEMLTSTLNLLKENDVKLKDNILFLFNTLINLEKSINRLNPNFDMFNVLFGNNSQINTFENESTTEKDESEKDDNSFLEIPHTKNTVPAVDVNQTTVLSQANEKTIDMIAQISDILKMAADGETKLNLKLTVAEESVSWVDKIINKLILCLIAVGLLIGACSMMSMNIGPKVFDIPIIGATLFVASIVLSMYLIIKLIKKK